MVLSLRILLASLVFFGMSWVVSADHEPASWEDNREENSWEGRRERNSWEGRRERNSWEGRRERNSWEGRREGENSIEERP